MVATAGATSTAATGTLVTVVAAGRAPALPADAAARGAPRHVHVGGVTLCRQADGREHDVLIGLSENRVGRDDQLSGIARRREREGQFAGVDRQRRQGGGAEQQGQSARQLVHERHGSTLRSGQKETGRQPSIRCRSAGGPADIGGETALVPWLCVTTFRRLCSEQLLSPTSVAKPQQPCYSTSRTPLRDNRHPAHGLASRSITPVARCYGADRYARRHDWKPIPRMLRGWVS